MRAERALFERLDGALQIHVAVDAMGGDFAPQATVTGAFQAAVDHGIPILLVGQRQPLEEKLRALGDHRGLVEIIHAGEVVGMDEPAITPIRKKRDSSIRVCAELVKEGRAQAMMTAGNTGAAMIVAKMVIGAIKGVDRPALAAVLPNLRGSTVVWMSVPISIAGRLICDSLQSWATSTLKKSSALARLGSA